MSVADKVRVAMIGAGPWPTGSTTRRWPPSTTWRSPASATSTGAAATRPPTSTASSGRYTDYRQMIEEVAPDAVYVIGQPAASCTTSGSGACSRGSTSTSRSRWASPCTRRATWPTWPRSTAASPRSASSAAPARMVVKLRDECLKRGPIVHAVCRFYKCSIEPLPRRARPHDGRRRARHRHAALDVRRRGGRASRASRKRVATPDINFITAMLAVRQRRDRAA